MIKNFLQSARWSDRSIGNLPCPASEKVCSTMKQNISIPPAKIPLFQRLHYILDKNVTLDLRWSTAGGVSLDRPSQVRISVRNLPTTRSKGRHIAY